MDGSLQGLNVRSSSIVLVYYIGVAILYWSYFHFFFFLKKNLDSVYKFTFVKANALEILAHYSCRRSSPKFFWTSTGYFWNSTDSFVPNSRFSPITGQVDSIVTRINIIRWDPTVCKSDRLLRPDTLRSPFIKSGYIR